MLSFTTDPYPPAHHELTRWTLEQLAAHGLAFCTLTKGGARALRDIDLFRPERDAFASTPTSLDVRHSLANGSARRPIRKQDSHAAQIP